MTKRKLRLIGIALTADPPNPHCIITEVYDEIDLAIDKFVRWLG